MTLDQIKTAVANYVVAAKQAGTWVSSSDNLADLVDKIAKTVTIDGLFADKLPQLDGEQLPFGKTIEEYFQDLVVVSDYDDEEDPNAPHYPTYQDPAYSYTLGRKVVKTTLKYDEYERAVKSADELATITNMVIKRLYDTYAVFKYGMKKQLVANAIAKCEAASNSATLVSTMAKPTDTTTGEAFIKSVKNCIESAGFVSEGNALNGSAAIGAEQGLLLIIKKGINGSLDVDTLAGAFNAERLAVPAEIVVVDDIPTATGKEYAFLVDRRALRLHPTYTAVREQMNAAGDFVNYFLHTENTAFISKNCFMHVWKEN